MLSSVGFMLVKGLGILLGAVVLGFAVLWLTECYYALRDYSFRWREIVAPVMLGVGALIVGFLLMAGSVLAGEQYPTVRELESGLGYSSGAQIPKDIPARGRGWHVYYMGARPVGNGDYDVRIRLR